MHEVYTMSYPVSAKPSAISADLQKYVTAATGDEGGLYNEIEFRDDIILNSYNEAYEFLQKHDYAYRCFAVKYIKSGQKPSKNYEDVCFKIQEQRIHLKELTRELSVHYRKSEFITCPVCKSRLSNKHFSGEKCPLCSTDLRSETTLKRLKAIEDKIKCLESKREKIGFEENRKLRNDKTKQYWLVKIEYHA